ncbi:MAG: SH3 domain-containing protein [Pseudomonadota bacterium]
MRGGGLTLLVLFAIGGCESQGGVFNDVLGDVVDTAASDASSRIVRDTTTSMCTSGNAMCRNATRTAVSGFTGAFMDQLTASDVRRIDQARRSSIRSGRPQEWSNPETGASGRVVSEPAERRPPRSTPVKVRRERVQSLPMMDAVGEPYSVDSAGSINVRGGPGTRYEVVDSLSGGERITAIGKVRGENWYLVGRGNVGIGYVSADLLKPWEAPADESLDEALANTDNDQGGAARNNDTGEAAADDDTGEAADDNDTGEAADDNDTGEAAEAADVAEVDVEMASECYTTTQTITLANGETEEAAVTSCRTPDGWAQV